MALPKRKMIALTFVLLASAITVWAKTIVSKQFVVKPGQYVYYKIPLKDDAQLVGRFRAEGGSGNDIKVLVLDEDAFENWRNGHTANAWYNSGDVTVGKINVSLKSNDAYYLIFSNTNSIFSNKVVSADIKLEE